MLPRIWVPTYTVVSTWDNTKCRLDFKKHTHLTGWNWSKEQMSESMKWLRYMTTYLRAFVIFFFGVLWKINVKNMCVNFHVVTEGSNRKAGLWFSDLYKIYLAWLNNNNDNNNKGLYCQHLKLIQIMQLLIACPVYSVLKYSFAGL